MMRSDPELEAELLQVLSKADALRKITNGRGPTIPPREPPLNPPGSGGTPDDMEARLAKLEAHMEHVQADLARLNDVPASLATLTEKVANLPTKEELGTKLRNYLATAGVIMAIVGTAIGIIFKAMGK